MRDHWPCRSLDMRHTQRYLAAYEWRYNRRFELPKNLERLARVAATIKPKPHSAIAAIRSTLAETSGKQDSQYKARRQS